MHSIGNHWVHFGRTNCAIQGQNLLWIMIHLMMSTLVPITSANVCVINNLNSSWPASAQHHNTHIHIAQYT